MSGLIGRLATRVAVETATAAGVTGLVAAQLPAAVIEATLRGTKDGVGEAVRSVRDLSRARSVRDVYGLAENVVAAATKIRPSAEVAVLLGRY